ncbi:hypothetical protein QEH52_08580 [Coraliomargarita sp. SDUM461003]|uniref:PEP-CTERM protein-sorting domain-containing protein n=1 Tax=Thalassobacterium maritimum TaxID=3041265 RepID=A0ABU1AX52_9BACT|nr:hypothetical protein [Coraliomargarita sp. SDUM461003]MDQ8207562.1 hypothetical protein [Coraliomargarita sp. SDUM461003]
MIKKTFLLAGLLTFSVSVNAAISVTDTAFFLDPSSHLSDADDRTISSFTVAAGSKLVVTTTQENSDISGITFGGNSLTAVYNTANSIQRVTTYYLDITTDTTADIVASVDGNTHFGFAAYAISGAAAGGPADFASSPTRLSGSFNTEVGSLVIGSFTKNSFNSITPTITSTVVYNETTIGSGGTSGASAYYFSTTTGTADYGFNNSNSRPAAGAVVFAVPEPSSAAALLGFTGLSIALIRRRR